MEHYRSLNAYLRETYGEKLYKLALDGGFTCPTRDGTLDTRGCIFCSARGSGDFAEDASRDVRAALARAKARGISQTEIHRMADEILNHYTE